MIIIIGKLICIYFMKFIFGVFGNNCFSVVVNIKFGGVLMRELVFFIFEVQVIFNNNVKLKFEEVFNCFFFLMMVIVIGNISNMIIILVNYMDKKVVVIMKFSKICCLLVFIFLMIFKVIF